MTHDRVVAAETQPGGSVTVSGKCQAGTTMSADDAEATEPHVSASHDGVAAVQVL